MFLRSCAKSKSKALHNYISTLQVQVASVAFSFGLGGDTDTGSFKHFFVLLHLFAENRCLINISQITVAKDECPLFQAEQYTAQP